MSRAIEIAHSTMVAALPKNVPPPYLEITSARFESNNCIVANVVMFDGKPATARFNHWTHGWSHGWDILIGGDCSFEDGAWMRVDAPSHLSIPGEA